MEMPSSSRFQFSISHLLIAVTAFACLLAIILTSHQATLERFKLNEEIRKGKEERAALAREYRQELAKLNSQLERMSTTSGVPFISHPQRISFTANLGSAPRDGQLYFRIYRPPGRQIVLCYAAVPSDDAPLPAALQRINLTSGAFDDSPDFSELAFSIVADYNNVDLTTPISFRLSVKGDIHGRIHRSEPLLTAPHFSESSGASFRDAVFPRPRRLGPDTPDVILWKRIAHSETAPWVVVWLEDQVPAATSSGVTDQSDQ